MARGDRLKVSTRAWVGGLDGGLDCDGWTSTTGTARVARVTAATADETLGCDQSAAFICLQR
jgi:hypothetical protein